MNMKQEYRIGELATQAGVNVETVRFYERKGLLRRPQNYGVRLYSRDHLHCIRFIKRAQECGFTLTESAELMNLSESLDVKCSDLSKRARDKIGQIEQKIEDLKKMKASLEMMAESCRGPDSSLLECELYRCFEEKQ